MKTNEEYRLLEQQLAAKDAEIARYKESPTVETCRKMIEEKAVKENEILHQQLAAKDAEIDEESHLRERMSKLLALTAIALKGPNEELSLHSWHDLPEKAEELQQQLANATKQNVLLRDALHFLMKCKQGEFCDNYVDAERKAKDALDATADLAGLVVCGAEPVAKVIEFHRNSPSIDKLLLWGKEPTEKHVMPHLISHVTLLYARKQP
jgi:hypothetical protein